MILDILAEAARERVAQQKKERSFADLRREAEGLSRSRAGIFRLSAREW